jgi:hypothetical protein
MELVVVSYMFVLNCVLRWHFLHEAYGDREQPFIFEAPVEGILGIVGPVPGVDLDILVCGHFLADILVQHSPDSVTMLVQQFRLVLRCVETWTMRYGDTDLAIKPDFFCSFGATGFSTGEGVSVTGCSAS